MTSITHLIEVYGVGQVVSPGGGDRGDSKWIDFSHRHTHAA